MAKEDTRDLLLEDIDEPAEAMRGDIPRDAVFELATDIKKNGLINPITVRPKGKRFEIVAGHRRFLAHRFGGILRIRCIVRTLTDDEAFGIMTSENMKREDVNPVDQASHVARLLQRNNNDIYKVAQICGYSPAWVESRIEIGAMQEDIKALLREGKIKLGVALSITQITDDIDRQAVLDIAVSQGTSVVMATYWLAQWRAGLFGHATARNVPDPDGPDMVRREVMLRCAVTGKEYPAAQIRTIFVGPENMGYIDALREHLLADAKFITQSDVDEALGNDARGVAERS